jgi:hypothetical protein
MKKFLVVSLMLVLLGGFVAAQGGTDEAASEVGVSANVTGKFDLVKSTSTTQDDVDPVTSAGYLNPDAVLTFKAEDEAAGVTVTLDLNELYFNVIVPTSNGEKAAAFTGDDDTAFAVWLKPLKNDLITIIAGYNAGDSTLRYGNMSAGDTIDGTGTVKVEQYINGFGGFVLTSQPIPELFFGIGYGNPEKGDIGKYYPGIHIGAGYTINGIGAIRAQYHGPYALNDSDEKNTLDGGIDTSSFTSLPTPDEILSAAVDAKVNSIQAGFKVLALEGSGLLLDIVGKIPLGYKFVDDKETVNLPAKIGVLAGFKTGSFSVDGGIGVVLPWTVYDNDGTKLETGMEFDIHVEPAYAVNDALTIGADLGFVFNKGGLSGAKYDGEDGEMDAVNNLGLGAFVKYAVGKGTLQAGVVFTVEDLSADKDKGHYTTNTFKIPLTLNVAY